MKVCVFSVAIRECGPHGLRLSRSGFCLNAVQAGRDLQKRLPFDSDKAKAPARIETYSRTNFACTLYCNLMVLKSSGSSSAATSAASNALALRITAILL